MSRIGNNPIKIPEGVQVELLQDEISVKGKLGQLKQNFSEVKIDISEGIISVQNLSKLKVLELNMVYIDHLFTTWFME